VVEVAIMVEGQDGLNWPRWQRFAKAVEDLGFIGLYRSDHFTHPHPPDRDSLELWVSMTWLASHTRRIEFGPLVSPISFRDPVMTARMGSQIDDLSGGRLTLGLGAGWQEREHTNFGYDLLDLDRRFARFQEGLEVVTGLLHNDDPVTLRGEFFNLSEAILLPRPQRKGGPPILVGGNGPQRTLPLVARYADEWNAFHITPDEFAKRNQQLDELLGAGGRQPNEVRRSLMTELVFGKTEKELYQRVETRIPGQTADVLREHGAVVGTPPEIIDQLGRLAEVGVQRVMLQWLDLDDMDSLQALAEATLGR
jgi:F420-dependent oxidoreductase-like protein